MKKLLLFVMCVLIALHLHGQTNQSPERLAIVPEAPEVGAVADLLTAEFSKRDQVHLLERAEIEKVYREQKLSAGNREYLKLGQILDADGLLILEQAKERSGQFLNIRLVAVRPGVVLTAEKFTWPLTNGLEWSSAFARHLDLFLPKLSVRAKDAIPISIINLRSAIASAEAPETERQLKLLAIQRLSREKQIFVLERQKMELLDNETQLAGLDSSEFWSGSYLLEGVIDRDGYSPDRMTINARLTPPKGGAAMQFEVSVNRTNLNEAVNDLAIKVMGALNLRSGATAWNAQDEAEEFFAEAKWAHRCGSFAEAQAASESSWALGKRTRDLAILRIKSYGDSIARGNIAIISDSGGNISAPAFPDAEMFPVLSRVLELYSQDAPLMFADPADADEECFAEGVRIFREAGSLLDGFYQAAELRTGHEDQLTELRRLARQTWLILESKAPLLPERSPRPWTSKPKHRLLSSEVIDQLAMYDLVKWEEGGVFFDQPEDALPMFRQMLEAGYIPTELPRIVGWSWNDRKRVPLVRRQFIADLSASTNPAVRLGGLSLSVVQTQFYPEAAFHEREQILVGAIWDYRDWVLGEAAHAMIVQRTEDMLRDKYYEYDWTLYFGREPFASVRQRLRKAYLTTRTNFDSQMIEALFYGTSSNISPGEARELIPLIENPEFAKWDRYKRSETYRQIAGLPPGTAASNSKPVMPADEPMRVKFTSWNGDAFGGTDYSKPQVQGMVRRGNQLWMRIKYLPPGEPFAPYESPSVYAAVDLQSGRSESIPFPEKAGFPTRGFEVSQDSLYVSVPNQLQRYRFKDKTWQAIPAPITMGADIIELDSRLYLSTADSLLEIAPGSGTVQILASSRRQPAVNELDSLLKDGAHEIFRADGQLGLAIGNQMFVFMRTNRTWGRLPKLSIKADWTEQTYWDRGALVIANGYRFQRLFGIAFNANAPELLFERIDNSGPANRPGKPEPGKPRWDWPAAFYLDASSLVTDGKNVWILRARKIPPYFMGTEETVGFQDNRQATLLHFEPGIRQVLMVPILFEKDGQPADPFDEKQFGFGAPRHPPQPYWIPTEKGFIVSCPNLMGHWLIPWTELEKRFAILRVAAQKAAAAGTNSIPAEGAQP
jgi:hypothetical protein